MTVYPISSSRHKTRAAVAALRRAGHKVFLDWTKNPPRHRDERDGILAIKDWNAASTADVTLMLWTPKMRGAWVEMGIALQARKKVVVVGCEDRDCCIFLWLPESTISFYRTLGEAVKHISQGEKFTADFLKWAGGFTVTNKTAVSA